MDQDQDIRAAIAAYTHAFPQSAPTITTRLLTKKDAMADGDLYRFLSDPKNPQFPHAQGAGWTTAEAATKLRANLAHRLDQLDADAAAKLAKIQTSTQEERDRLAAAKQLVVV